MKKIVFIISATFVLLVFLLLACKKTPEVTEREGEPSFFELFFEGRKLAPEEVDAIEEGVRFFSLPKEARPNEELSLDLKFSFHVNPQDNGDIFLRRWYPKLWWDGRPARDSFLVKVEVPAGYQLASSGRLN